MTIPTSAQSADAVIDQLVVACCSIFGATLDADIDEYTATWNDGTTDRTLVVVEASPSRYDPDVIVAVATAVNQPIERPTQGPQRSREITATVDIVFSVALPGGRQAKTEARRVASVAAQLLELYFRQPGNETLDGACRDAWVSSIKGPDMATLNTPEGGVWGYAADLTATVTTRIRN